MRALFPSVHDIEECLESEVLRAGVGWHMGLKGLADCGAPGDLWDPEDLFHEGLFCRD